MQLIASALFVALIGLAFVPTQFSFSRPAPIRQISGSARFINFNLQHCLHNKCLDVKAPDAIESGLFGVISFTHANVRHSTAEFSGEGFYDKGSDKIFFDNIRNQKFTQAYFDFKTGDLVKIF
jgi:hypothetical protein